MSVLIMEEPDKSESDKKLYRAVKLSNGLRAMLVSQPEMDDRASIKRVAQENSTSKSSLEEYDSISACACNISVGSFYAPKKYQGLPHFLEHMIFMGSEKYPEENAFEAFVTNAGGFLNAHTEDENTCFYFDVADQYLEKSLDMLMNLLKAPLMSIDSMTRERSAVQAEFDDEYNNDQLRLNQVRATMASENYPHATFACGNLKSLAKNVNDVELHKELKDFHRKHYGSNRMTVCIQSTLPLDELQKILLRHCSDIPRSLEDAMDMSKFKYRDTFQEHFFRDVLVVKPVENICILELTWVLPSMHGYYRVKPCDLMAHLLGYEGVGSLCAYLRHRLWAGSLYASHNTNFIFSTFVISIALSGDGFSHLDEVIAVTFAWIRMLCSFDIPLQSTYKEVQQMAETNFRFQKEGSPISNVLNIVDFLHIYPNKDVLTGNDLFFEYNDEIVKMVQQHLNEFRFQILIFKWVPYVQYLKTERWYESQFTQLTMPEKWKTMWTNPEPHSELQFPAPNSFVPTDFAIQWVKAGKPHIPRCPKALIQNELCELWFRQDDTFLLPEGIIMMNLITPLICQNVKDFLAGILFTRLVIIELADQFYPAHEAGLDYELGVQNTGLRINVHGYTEKIELLCEMIVNMMKTVEINSVQVMTFMASYQQSLIKRLVEASSLKDDLLESVVQQKGWTLREKYEAIKTITPQDVRRFRDTFHKQMYIQALIQGNFSEQQALRITENVLNTFQSGKFENYAAMNNRTVQLPHGEFFLRVKSVNEDDANTLLGNYHQLGPSSVTMTVMLELLHLITEEPFFNQLRTKEEMCYSLGITQRIFNNIGGYLLYIDSRETKFAADFVEKRVEKFRLSMHSIVSQLSEDEYKQFRQALINRKRQANLSLDDEVSEYWPEITSLDYFFNRTELEIKSLAGIEKKDLLEFMKLEYTNMRKLSVQVIGSSHPKKKQTKNLKKKKSQSDVNDSRTPAPVSDEEKIFEQIGNYKLEFIGDPRNPSHIMNIAEFKNNLYVYPRISLNPKTNKQDT